MKQFFNNFHNIYPINYILIKHNVAKPLEIIR